MASKNYSINRDLILDLFFPKEGELDQLFQPAEVKEANRSTFLPHDPKDLYIWILEVNSFSNAELNRLFNYLSMEEKNKANNYHFEIDRKRYILGRAVLKQLIAKYTKRDVHSIHFGYNSSKKPFLVPNNNKLQFNLSHSGELIAIGFGFDEVKIGIDIEMTDPSYDYDLILRDYFTENEKGLIEEFGYPAFFKIWTRKEALFKAQGIGLTDEMRWTSVLRKKGINSLKAFNQTFYCKTMHFDLKYYLSIVSNTPLKSITYHRYSILI